VAVSAIWDDGNVCIEQVQARADSQTFHLRRPQSWYDLTGLVRPGIAFWPMAQQYRHIIAGNPERLICNHNLFDLAPADLSTLGSQSLVAILNSTLLGLFKTFTAVLRVLRGTSRLKS